MVAIPASFYLMGRKISVAFRDDLTFEDGNLGLAIYKQNTIQLQSNTNGYARPEDDVEQTFFHELMHFIMHFLNRTELRDDEEFIEQVSGLLHQALATAVYAKDET